jgi:hypothetical protein
MAVTLKIKRRASAGAAGAPNALKAGELAYNENTGDQSLYYGYGDDGSGNATSVIAIGGSGAYATLSTNQTISGNKTFTGTVALGSATVTGLDTTEVSEGTNLYYTDARARGAISVTDSGGDGSLSYNSSTGVLTYTGPSAAEVRAHFSATSASGVTYNSSTGVIALSAVPNSSLANSSFSINSNSVSLGGSVTLDTDDIGEGSTNRYYTDARARAAISAASPTTGVAYNSTTGVISLASIPNSALSNSSITINGVATPLGGSTTTTAVTTSLGATITLQGTAGEVDVATNAGTGTFTIGLPDIVNITDDLNVGGDLTVTGDLTVNGAITSLSTTEVKVEDKNIVLGDTASPTNTTADGGGITLKGASDYTITWVNATSSWSFNQSVNVTSGGYKVAGTEVLSSSRVMSNVAITGSGNTIDNVTLDGGTF